MRSKLLAAVAGVVVAIATGPALAADLPVKAVPRAVATPLSASGYLEL